MNLSTHSKVKLGIAPPDVKAASAETAREWIEDVLANSEYNRRKASSLNNKLPDDRVLPTGVVIAGGLIAHIEGDDDIRKEYVEKGDNFNVFNTVLTVKLNQYLKEIIANGSVTIPGSSEVYEKIEGDTPEQTEYLNTGQLIIPVAEYINRETLVLGTAKKYDVSSTFTIREGSVAEDIIIGIMSDLVVGLSEASARELLGMAGTVSEDVNAAVAEDAKTTVYNFLTPIYYYDEGAKTVECYFHLIPCVMGETTIKYVKKCAADKEEDVVTVYMEVATFDVDFERLEDILPSRNSRPVDAGREWFKLNVEANKVGVTEDANASPNSVSAMAKDVL